MYQQFAPDRQTPLRQADWTGEVTDLRQSALLKVGVTLTVAGYAWALLAGLVMHPSFAWGPLVLPGSLGMLGLLILVVRRPPALRAALFIAGSLAVSVAVLFLERSIAAPFVAVAAVSAASLVSAPWVGFAVAAAAGGSLGLAAGRFPGVWPDDLVTAALALYWVVALSSWLMSRDLYTVLTWALHGYDSASAMMRELQGQRGKLNRTMKALADANLLLKRTTYDLAEARQEAERARQLKSQFATNISHELRTPLHLIIGFSQMMYASPETYKGVRWTADLREDIAEIHDSAQHLLRLIDDVLDLSRVEAARLPMSRELVALAPLMREAAHTAQSLLRGRDLYLRLDLPEELPPVYADPTRIRQVLLNLLNNAARFTEEGGITVRAAAHEDEIEVTVSDTGIGMSVDQLKDIFTEFHQVDASIRRRHDGTGLGLAICKQFILLHDGRIWAESRAGQGSTFHFTLPLPGAQQVPLQRPRVPAGWRYPAGRPGGKRRVVTLSRPEGFARILRRYMADTEVLEAETPEEVAPLARRAQADAVVLAAEAEDVADRAALAEATADLALPVIECSMPLERHMALAEGFTHCLMKPFVTEQLLRTLREAAPGARRALVVDDDPGVVRLIRHMMASGGLGLEVLTAYDGREAIARLEERPEVVLLDLIMPEVNGLEVLRELRRRPWGKEVPVVAITAYGFAGDIASLGQGRITVRRGRHFTAGEITQWLETVLEAMPAQYLATG